MVLNHHQSEIHLNKRYEMEDQAIYMDPITLPN